MIIEKPKNFSCALGPKVYKSGSAYKRTLNNLNSLIKKYRDKINIIDKT